MDSRDGVAVPQRQLGPVPRLPRGTRRAAPATVGRYRNSFYDEVATFEHAFEDDQPTNLRLGRPERTMIRLDDPQPTIPPETREPSVVAVRPARQTTSPTTIGRYAIERLIGQGAFGRVFAARDTKLGRTVALKVLHARHAASSEIRQRFVQEAHAAACIAHPGIVTVFDAGELDDNGTAFIAMEMLAGESLHTRLSTGGTLSADTVRELGRQIASTLEAAHRAGVIHRDLKPENIFLVPDPAATHGERVKVLDFGLAKPTLTASVKTHAATVFGTPAYMSPEQCESTRDIDHRSDIYALGCIMFQLLTGRAPFEGTMRELITQHRTVAPPSLRKLAPEIDPALEALINAMLAKEPAGRPQAMAEVERMLRPMSDAEETRELPAMPRTSRAPRHAISIALVAIGLSAGLFFSV